jgi:hypothetical protein
LAEAGIGELSLQVKASWLKSQWSVKRGQSTRLLGTLLKLLTERPMYVGFGMFCALKPSLRAPGL